LFGSDISPQNEKKKDSTTENVKCPKNLKKETIFLFDNFILSFLFLDYSRIRKKIVDNYEVGNNYI